MKNYVEIAKETLNIIESNGYTIDSKFISLAKNNNDLTRTVVYDPKNIVEVKNNLQNIKSVNKCEIKVDMLDSLTSAKLNGEGKTIVLNFANAFRPGGGFLYGSSAQEEAICRCSTLYVSLTSEVASQMYKYNNANITQEGSDFLLITPDVVVFRDKDCNLLTNPYTVSVVTAAAPNLYYEASDLYEPKLGEVVRHKIRNILSVCASCSYDTLILGAWGCGAFGHDAKDMAKYFHTVLIEEDYQRFFKKVVFSIYSSGGISYNYAQFENVFMK